MRDLLAQYEDLPDSTEIGGQEYQMDKASWSEFRDADDEDMKRNWLASVG